MNNSNDDSVSLNKYISSSGMCSRREADRYIAEDCVTINGKAAQAGNRVYEGDVVRVDGKLIKHKTRPMYIAFNKPVGVVCTTDEREPGNIISYINHPVKLFPIGRLDKLSQGLIFLTNDGDIVNKILRAGNNHEKEYVVAVDKPITPAFVQRMSSGVKILGTITKKCTVTRISDLTFRIILTQGLNRQIRRMCEQLGYNVTKLNRTRIMNVKLGKLETGKWRPLTDAEMDEINSLVADSSKTEEASKDVRRPAGRSPRPKGKGMGNGPGGGAGKKPGKFPAKGLAKGPKRLGR